MSFASKLIEGALRRTNVLGRGSARVENQFVTRKSSCFPSICYQTLGHYLEAPEPKLNNSQRVSNVASVIFSDFVYTNLI